MFGIYREILNRKEASLNYIISYEDNLLINEELKYFLDVESGEISLLNLYRKISDIKSESKLRELGNILNLKEHERSNKLNIFLNLNKLLLINIKKYSYCTLILFIIIYVFIHSSSYYPFFLLLIFINIIFYSIVCCGILPTLGITSHYNWLCL